MNWVTDIPTIVTGVVGVAGIGGTILSARIARKSAADTARLTITAENERITLAEKRRIYAECISALTMPLAASLPDSEKNTFDAALTANNLVAELGLIAPQDIQEKAKTTMYLLTNVRSDDPVTRGQAANSIADLTSTMQADLNGASGPVPLFKASDS
jgi:hypothetical protein